ncbi:FG-GAP repeat domain-containing protein [Oleiharenicola lentus]|uniref:FG-GAP repeat domain-containing protein n=1 Tax=Oleiharenicola lentus TaxID=2508720 RepID=UPI003F666FF9
MNPRIIRSALGFFIGAGVSVLGWSAPVEGEMPRLAYNNPGLVVDLGVGLWAWPLPMDYNGDGKMDLVVVCSDKPHNGTWYFENSGQTDPETKLPLFKPAVLIGKSAPSAGIGYSTGKPIVTATASLKKDDTLRFRGNVFPDFTKSQFTQPKKLSVPEEIHTQPGNIRQNQWQVVDFDGDGLLDVTLGIDFWGDFGVVSPTESLWSDKGEWKAGPLRGYVYLLRNTGTNDKPKYAAPEKVMAGGKPVDPYGMPSPMWGDFRGTGKLDLITGEFRDSFTFFENTGTRTKPVYAEGRALKAKGGDRLAMDLCMITPVAVDFNGDGKLDIVCGDEDGRVAFIENTGKVVDGAPQFLPPRYFKQFADKVKFGALITPYAVDWDGDGREDLVAGNSAGHIAFFKNLGGEPVRWAAPEFLKAEGKIIRELAGPNGSIQGPAEEKWGYSILSVEDFDGDGLSDIVTNGIWGKIVWYKNIGTRTAPKLAAAKPVELSEGAPVQNLAWNWWKPKGRELVTQWRTTPQLIDWNKDGVTDLVMHDTQGYLALYAGQRDRSGKVTVGAPQRIFFGEGISAYDPNGKPTNSESGLLRLNSLDAGRSGRRTFQITDWDGDGQLDLLVNSNPNVNFLRGKGRDAEGRYVFKDEGAVSAHVLAGHATKPTMIDLHGNGRRDLLIGAEDGFLYFLKSPAKK